MADRSVTVGSDRKANGVGASGRRARKAPIVSLICVTVLAMLASAVPLFVSAAEAQGEVCDGLTATLVGTEGDDTLVGTWQADVIVGLGGDDTISGLAGDDTICGGEGDDTITGDSGADLIFGEAGDDVISGKSGSDTIFGGAGNDTIDGDSQADAIHGGDDDDAINGGAGNDALDGGNGLDVVDGSWATDTCDDAETAPNCETITFNGEENTPVDPPPAEPFSCNGLTATIVGTSGDDILQGTWQDDVIVGLGGDDTIFGQAGADTICGGDGDDIINGASQDDTIFGGAGDDVISGKSGADTIFGGPGNDTLDGDSQSDTINGDNGDDAINGGAGPDVLDGGNGVDTIDGSWADDTCTNGETYLSCETTTNDENPPDPVLCLGLDATIVGTEADDTLTGTEGPDVIAGLGGNDTITGLGGDDTICGGLGDDDLVGSLGLDELDGGDGVDSCDAELFVDCESAPGPGQPGEVVSVVDPVDREDPTSFYKTDEGTNATLFVVTAGDLYPFDIFVDPASFAGDLDAVLGGPAVDLQRNPLSRAFETAVLTLPYDENLTASLPEADLRIWTFDATSDTWVVVPGDQLVDTNRNEVSVTLEHFSCYAVLTSQPAPGTGQCTSLPRTLFVEGFIDVPGLSIPQTTLLQPASVPVGAIADQSVVQRLADGRIQTSRIAFDEVVLYQPDGTIDASQQCLACRALDAAGPAAVQTAVFTQSVFASNLLLITLESDFVADVVIAACVFDAIDDFEGCEGRASLIHDGEAAGYLDWDTIGGPFSIDPDLGEDHQIVYEDFTLDDVALLLQVLFDGGGQPLFESPAAMRMIGLKDGENDFVAAACNILPGPRCKIDKLNYSPQALRAVAHYRLLLNELLRDFDAVESVLGSEFTLDQLLNGSGLPASVQAAIGPVALSYDSSLEDQYYFFQDDDTNESPVDLVDHQYFRVMAVRLQSYDGDPEAAKEILLSFPTVIDDAVGGYQYFAVETDNPDFDIRRFTGFENQLRLLFELAIGALANGTTTEKYEAIRHMPETRRGIRNQLITAMYYEAGRSLQAWVDGAPIGSAASDLRPATWGTLGAWPSEGIGPVIRGDLNWIADLANDAGSKGEHQIRQAAANGNQWIFSEYRRFISLLEFVSNEPNPTIQEWEAWFNSAQFRANDQKARDAMLALVASRYAASPFDQQRLMFMSTLLFADLEQQGAQKYLEEFDALNLAGVVPSGTLLDALVGNIASAFINLQMGDQRIDVTSGLAGTYGIALDSFIVGEDNGEDLERNHDPEFWTRSFVCFNTTDCEDPSYEYEPLDAPGVPDLAALSATFDSQIDIEFSGSSPCAINVSPLALYPGERDFYSPAWDEWRTGAAGVSGQSSTELYSGVAVGTWPNFDERMWYIYNLFRLSFMDPSVKAPPYLFNEAEGTGSTFADSDHGWSAATVAALRVTTFDTSVPPIVVPGSCNVANLTRLTNGFGVGEEDARSALSADGSIVAYRRTSDAADEVVVQRVDTGEVLFEDSPSDVTGVLALSSDGSILMVDSGNATQIYELTGGAYSLVDDLAVASPAMSSNGQFVVGRRVLFEGFSIIDLATGLTEIRFLDEGGEPNPIAISNDGDSVLLVGRLNNGPDSLIVYTVSTQTQTTIAVTSDQFSGFENPTMSENGRFVAYSTVIAFSSANDTPEPITVLDRDSDVNGVYDEVGTTVSTQLASTASIQVRGGESIPDWTVQWARISGDGSSLAVIGEQRPDPFEPGTRAFIELIDIQTDTVISSTELDAPPETVFSIGGITTTGSQVIFTSIPDLVPSDTNGSSDVYLWESQ